MQLNKNKVVIACAGSGKTTYIVEEAFKLKDTCKRILVTTYTIENLEQIKSFFSLKYRCIPSNIFIQSWFSFLLQEGVRPYQNQVTDKKRVQSIDFRTSISIYHKKNNYLTSSNNIYSEKVAEFVHECNQKTKGLVSKRLERIYDYIFIDELQDFAGYDLNLLEMFFKSKINVIAVGDSRQATFSTNNARKNKQYRKSKIHSWLKEKERKQTIKIEEKRDCIRCNQKICDFADSLFPDLPKTNSLNNIITEHDGIFSISSAQVSNYVRQYNPVILRYSKSTYTMSLPAMNIGLSKGRTYDRVLIFPTNPMLEFLRTKDPSRAGDIAKLYVAVTRAKHSVAFVVN